MLATLSNNLYYIILILYVILSAFLILLVLIQKGRGGGLASAFGGVGGNTAFGAKTGDVLTWATSIVFGVLMLMTISLVMIGNSIHDTNVSEANARNTLESAIAQPETAGDKSSAPTALPPVDLTPSTAPSTTKPSTQP